MKEEIINEYALVDEITCARCGSLSAHGLTDQQIEKALLLTNEQVLSAKNSIAFKNKYGEEAEKQIQLQIDLADGWNAVEEKALAQVFETLQYNRDPKYALVAAQMANKAIRRQGSAQNPIVVDNSKQETNIIILNLNKNYANKNSEAKTIDVAPRDTTQPQRRSDLPSPKAVAALLAPVQIEQPKIMSDLERQFKEAGVVFDNAEETS